MSRLNKATRDYIVEQAILKSGIPEALAVNERATHDWANRLRIESNGVSDEALADLEARFRALSQKVPVELRHQTNPITKGTCFSPVLGGMVIGQVAFGPGSDAARPCVWRPRISSDNPLFAEWHALNDRAKELKEQRDVLKAQIKAVVESVPTIQKLLEVWPEAKELLPKGEQPIVSNVPAVLITSLNAAIGLPSEEDAE